MTLESGAPQGGAWVPLLLADPSPNLRLLVLREMLGRPAGDPEVRELVSLRESDPIVENLLSIQDADGSWPPPEGGGGGGPRIRSTAQALIRLGYLGFDSAHRAVQRGAGYLFRLQQEDGSWPLPQGKGEAERELREGYSMIPLQTGMPLRALAMAGHATDARAERAYEWLLARKLPDGGWPTGVRGGKQVFAGGYRRLAHSQFGCRTNTTFAVSALAYHPERRSSPAARRGLDLLLAQDSLPAHTLGFEVARTIGAERTRGFFTYFARYDVGLILDLCWRIGASLEDERVAGMVAFVKGLQGRYGLWDYAPQPEASRWVSFDLLRSLSHIDLESDWLSVEPPTPFQPYPKRPRRY
jgi:hypothetical protein